jgi:predicted  nucleic acid-binding Zn-ribbon protein
VLQNRKSRFDNAAARISQRITRVEGIADRVEAKGGDVSAVRASLDKARALLVEARTAEAAAGELFKAVPTAGDKKASFAAARAQAKVAMKTLQSARVTLRNAVLDLRAVANGLKGAQ